MVHSVMATCYPEWVQPRPMPGLAGGEKDPRWIRLGGFCTGSVARAIPAGSAPQSDQFQVFCYHTGLAADSWTEEFRRLSSLFYHSPVVWRPCAGRSWRPFARPGIPGYRMDPVAMQLVLCVSLPFRPPPGVIRQRPPSNVDYFLSSELMEPRTGRLTTRTAGRLPASAVATKSRMYRNLALENKADFGIAQGAVAYLSGQQIYKYLPDQDRVFARIAARVKAAQLCLCRRTHWLEEICACGSSVLSPRKACEWLATACFCRNKNARLFEPARLCDISWTRWSGRAATRP